MNGSASALNEPFVEMKGVRTLKWKYNGGNHSPQSALVILRGSFLSNRTLKWIVEMKNKRNPSFRVTASLLVRVEETVRPLIAIG